MVLQQVVVSVPQAPATPGAPGAPQVLVDGKPLTSSPSAIYQAAVKQREVLGNQMERLQDERRDITNRLNNTEQDQQLSSADKAGLEKRLTTLDSRIDVMDKQIAGADAQVAATAGIPGAVVERP